MTGAGSHDAAHSAQPFYSGIWVCRRHGDDASTRRAIPSTGDFEAATLKSAAQLRREPESARPNALIAVGTSQLNGGQEGQHPWGVGVSPDEIARGRLVAVTEQPRH